MGVWGTKDWFPFPFLTLLGFMCLFFASHRERSHRLLVMCLPCCPLRGQKCQMWLAMGFLASPGLCKFVFLLVRDCKTSRSNINDSFYCCFFNVYLRSWVQRMLWKSWRVRLCGARRQVFGSEAKRTSCIVTAAEPGTDVQSSCARLQRS